MNLTTATPAEIDSLIAPLARRLAGAEAHAAEMLKSDRPERYAAAVARTEAVIAELRAELAPLTAEYARRGGWTRAFAVPGGHVHRSTSCHTCFVSTSFGWLPQVSGLDEAEIVELAGERACTVCYPTAPVAALARPSRLYSADEQADREAAAKRAEELAAKKALAATKAITNPDGSPLRDADRYVVKTEVAARNGALQCFADLLWYGETHPSAEGWKAYAERAVVALAAKRGVAADEVRAELVGKAEKKHAKLLRS